MHKTFDRRTFLKSSGLAGLSLSIPEWPLLSDKKYWEKIRSKFPISSSPLINLNSGSAGSQSHQTQKSVHKYYASCNASPFYQKVIEWVPEKKAITNGLAEIIGASEDEVCLTRNTTEGLQTIINGFPFQRGDHVLLSSSDYSTIQSFIRSKAKMEDLEYTEVTLGTFEMSDDEIISIYKNAITPRTKLILLTHIENRYGRLLPIREITEIAHSKNAEVVLDAAQSFGHYPHNIKELNVDYYATSLHKWFNAPYGTGLLYIKKDKIAKIHPLYPYRDIKTNRIDKFQYIGTHASFLTMGIASALVEYHEVGIYRKQERLQELTNCIEKKASKINSLQVLKVDNTIPTGIISLDCGDLSHDQLVQYLRNKWNINIKKVNYYKTGAIRISPNIYNTEEEIDQLFQGIKSYMDS